MSNYLNRTGELRSSGLLRSE